MSPGRSGASRILLLDDGDAAVVGRDGCLVAEPDGDGAVAGRDSGVLEETGDGGMLGGAR